MSLINANKTSKTNNNNAYSNNSNYESNYYNISDKRNQVSTLLPSSYLPSQINVHSHKLDYRNNEKVDVNAFDFSKHDGKQNLPVNKYNTTSITSGKRGGSGGGRGRGGRAVESSSLKLFQNSKRKNNVEQIDDFEIQQVISNTTGYIFNILIVQYIMEFILYLIYFRKKL